MDLFTSLHEAGSLADGDFRVVEPVVTDYARMADMVVTYGDLPLRRTDAAVVAIAERLKLTDVAILEGRHFTVVRPSHVDALTLLP